jgi:hypothetical protein
MIVAVSANINVNRMELQKLGSVRMLLKFSSPTGYVSNSLRTSCVIEV